MTITAKVLAASIASDGKEIITFELEYPRFIHSEFLTHRQLGRNAASSRAIPVSRAIELIKEDTAMPIHWGKNQPGMSAKEECNVTFNEMVPVTDKAGNAIMNLNGTIRERIETLTREDKWNEARDAAIHYASQFNDAGYHKQIVNRLLEPFTHIKVVTTATEWDNFFYLRNHKDAQPEIHELASKMLEAKNLAIFQHLLPGEWHVPYYMDGYWIPSKPKSSIDAHGNTLDDALAISASCCAQVSYRRLDTSIEKADNIYHKLVTLDPMHSSPFEHSATPMQGKGFKEAGVTHMDKAKNYWSGNLKGWIQYRQLIMEQKNYEPMTSRKIENE
jgi:thymidylate synthase ThyX